MHSVAIAPTLEDRLLVAERASAESRALLRKMLPDFVIDRLMARPGERITDHFADASVLFADMAGFVAIAKTLGGPRTVELLDTLTRQFDMLAARHGVEKIKTIGDGYMAVAGVPEPQRDHCRRLARLALDMLAVADAIGSRFGVAVTLRIGIAAGPVTAGVIGTNKVSYDVWGDTVNLAARLEQLAACGQILVSSRAAVQLADAFEFGPGSRVDVRGLGPVEICALGGASNAPAFAH